MKGDTKVIEFLNKVLYNELTAINQYFLHAKMLKNWGIKELAEHEYKESIDEMKHADMLADRILFLEGLPNFQALGKLRIGENPTEILQCDLSLERDGVVTLREAVAYSDSVGDYVSRQLFVNPRLGRRAHRLAGNPARPDRAHRRAEVPAEQAGRLTQPAWPARCCAR